MRIWPSPRMHTTRLVPRAKKSKNSYQTSMLFEQGTKCIRNEHVCEYGKVHVCIPPDWYPVLKNPTIHTKRVCYSSREQNAYGMNTYANMAKSTYAYHQIGIPLYKITKCIPDVYAIRAGKKCIRNEYVCEYGQVHVCIPPDCYTVL